MKPSTFRKFLFFKMPIAWIAGLKLKLLTNESATIKVRLTKFSQNPFRSMFWAVQGMAAELSTGILLMNQIQKEQKKVSFLVIEQNGQFFKKAIGTIRFECNQGKDIESIIGGLTPENPINTLKLYSKGFNENNELVAEFWFLWSFKLKS